MNRRRIRAVFGTAVIAVLVAALAGSPAAAAEPGRIAVVLHLAGGPSPNLAASAAEVRAAAFETLAGLAGARGLTLAERAATDDLLRRHRLRQGGALTPEFLAEARESLRTDELYAVGLLCESDRLAVAIRVVDATTGRLRAAGQAEVALGASPWQAALAAALGRAFPDTIATATTGPGLLVLPARAVGLDAQSGRHAAGAVLAEAIADGRWAVVDPALATGLVNAAGRDLELLDATAREVLRDRFGTPWAVIPELVGFGVADAASGAVGTADPRFTEPAAGGARPAADLMFTLQLLDLRTGRIRHAASVMVPGEPSPGWFGNVNSTTELDQVRKAATELWAQFRRILEEQSS